MKKLILFLSVVLLTACQGKADNSASNANSETTTLSKNDTGIPVGVQELPENMTYDVDKAPGHLVVIDFNATWCAPCRNFAPIFEEASQQFAGEVEFISVNVDQHQELVQKLGIQSIPFLLFIQPDGKLNSWVGFLPQEEFIKAIKELK